MKKLLLSFLWITGTATFVLAQKTIKDPNVEQRKVSGFHGIHVGTGIALILTEGSTEAVAVSAATAEFRDRIETKVENGILKIYYDNKLSSINTKKERKDLKAYVSYKSLDELDANTGADVEIDGTLQSTSLKLKANTGAAIRGKVSVGDLKVNQNTGSIIMLSGHAEKLEIEGDTGSRFEGVELTTSICNARVSTGADISVTAQKELNAKANTGGSVRYKGDAPVKEVKKGTGGSVTKIKK